MPRGRLMKKGIKINFEAWRQKKDHESRLIRQIISNNLHGKFTENEINGISEAVIKGVSDANHQIQCLQFNRGMRSLIKATNREIQDYGNSFSRLSKKNSNAVSSLIQETAKKHGVSIDEVNRVLAVLEEVANYQSVAILNTKKNNPKTNTGIFDLHVGEVLVESGLCRKDAARVVVEIRSILAHAAVVKKPTDYEKEVLAVEQRLRNAGFSTN